MTNYERREAARLGNEASIDAVQDPQVERNAREIRAENIRRTEANRVANLAVSCGIRQLS